MAGAGEDMTIDIGFPRVGEQQSRAIDPCDRPTDLELEGSGKRDYQLPSADVATRRQLRAGNQLLGNKKV